LAATRASPLMAPIGSAKRSWPSLYQVPGKVCIGAVGGTLVTFIRLVDVRSVTPLSDRVIEVVPLVVELPCTWTDLRKSRVVIPHIARGHQLIVRRGTGNIKGLSGRRRSGFIGESVVELWARAFEKMWRKR
jgi:hypothetical protein